MLEDRMNELREFSRSWYTLSRSFLPKFQTEKFAAFAGEGNAFSYDVVGKVSDDKPISIRVTKNTDTAYVDLRTNSIYLSSKYFTKELYEKFVGETEDLEEIAIGLINGSIIHEALHIRHTTSLDIEDALKRIPHRFERAVAKFGKQPVFFMFNVLEDIYIEAQVDDKLVKWIEASDNILFTEDSFEHKELEDIFAVINLAVMYKNRNLRDNPEFERLPSEALDILERLADPKNKSVILDRVRATYDFLDCFEFETEDGVDGGDGEGSDGEGSDGDKDSDGSESVEVKGEPIPSKGKEILDSIEDLSDEELEALDEILSEVAKEIAESEKELTEFSAGFDKCYFKKVLERDIHKAGTYGKSAYPKNSTDFSFLKELVASRTVNRTPGQARTRGSVMVKQRLTRIATDGKIFAKRDAERQRKSRIEIIINIDYSGSTRGPIINGEVGAAKEISKVLRQANIAHSVYGHTSKGGDTPFLVHIFSHDMTNNNQDWEDRFTKAEGIHLEQNYDGVIIERLTEKFTGRNATRYIINLSDGSPCGPGYSGEAAKEHTKQAIGKAREAGINVFSISVVSHVVKDNNHIYGKDFNIDASRNVAQQFRRLIGKLVGM